MPELPNPKLKAHPSKAGRAGGGEAAAPAAFGYAELCVTSNFTFLTGASHPDELVGRAAALGYRAVGIADLHSLAGVVRAHVAAREAGLPLAVGTRLVLVDPPGLTLCVYPTDKASYGRLCRLLTLGKRRAEKGRCRLSLADVAEYSAGLLAIVLPPIRAATDAASTPHLALLRDIFDDDRLSLALCCGYDHDDREQLRQLADRARRAGVPVVATNDVHHHAPERQKLQDVLTCIRLGCTLETLGLRRRANAERHLKSPDEMHRLFAEYPAALARTLEIAGRAAQFSLESLRYEYPDEVVPAGRTPMEHLRDLTARGAAERYPDGVPAKVAAQIEHELSLIAELNYAPYFLTVHDIVTFARARNILCQGRGAAANSAVCYCLGVTSVDPDRIDVLFERFVSRERDEPPDIDIDFEHERREEVIQYLYAKYGRERAALTAEVITYRGRSAVREVGKAFGLSLDCVDRLARTMGWWERGVVDAERIRELGLDPNDTTLRWVMTLADELLGFPRHLSQHVGGFVITRTPLCELVPIENAAMEERTVIEWDKDDIEAVGMLKVDVLGLGMLTCIRKAFDLLAAQYAEPCTLATLPAEDPVVYDMICRADTVGVFQIESRAQMSMLPRLRPRSYYDLVIEVSIVRPGPIVGKMVHPYLRRRNGREPATYASPVVERVLAKTLGVPLFQEQAMQLAIHCADFTPGEAELLRRTIAAWKTRGKKIAEFGLRLVEGMVRNGYEREFAERVFEQIKGFSSYGFPESHAASFALLVYASAWLKCHRPEVFACALLNSLPMGFYAPAQIVRDAQVHGVEVRPVDVNHSDWDCTLEPAIRAATVSEPASVTANFHEPPADEGGSEGVLPAVLRQSAGSDSQRFARPLPHGRGSDAAPRPFALRLGLRLVGGLGEAAARRLVAAVRRSGPFRSIAALRRAGAPPAALRKLAEADAFGSMGLDRQAALWELLAVDDEELPLFDQLDGPVSDEPAPLPAVAPPTRVVQDYAAVGLSLKAHPLSFLRAWLARQHVTPAGELQDVKRWPAGRWIVVAGIVLVRQRPSTAHGVVFFTLEDETGIANLIVRPPVYERYRRAARDSVILVAEGRVERDVDGNVVHVLVTNLRSADAAFAGMESQSRDFH